MPFDGSGNFTRDHTWASDAAAGIKIKADIHDTHDQDIANAVSLMICKDGRSSPTADINWGAKKITNMAPGSANTDAATVGQVLGVRNFPSAISITGSFPESLIKFTGTTGPWGNSYTTAGTDGMFAGVSAAGTDWVWNDKADGSGNLVMALNEAGQLLLFSKDAGASVSPIIELYRESPSPAASDIGGTIKFTGKNSALTKVTYADVYMQMNDAVNASMDSSLIFRTQTAGSLTAALTLGATVATVHSPLVASGSVQAGTYFYGGQHAIMQVTASGGYCALRPTVGTSAGQLWVVANGDTTISRNLDVLGTSITVAGNVTASGGVFADTYFRSTAASVFLGGQGGAGAQVVLRAKWDTSAGQTTIDAAGAMIVNGPITSTSNGVFQGLTLTLNGGYHASGGSYGATFNTYWWRSSATGTGGTALYQFYNANGSVGSITVSGSGTSFGTTSDANLKNVGGGYDPAEAIAIIRADPVLGWTWKSSGEAAIGWVAQVSHAVSPDLAMPPAPAPGDPEQPVGFGEEGYVPWMMDYSKRTPYLWAALSWALDQIDDLKTRLAAVEGAPA